MPKQKIEVNESLNVSIGELLNLKNQESPPKVNEEMARTEYPRAPHDLDIKKIVSKFGKISLQHQRAGRGGKTVTLISVSSGEAEPKLKQNLEALLKELKKSLGCGGQIEEGKIILHGEIADRATEWFAKMGAKQ